MVGKGEIELGKLGDPLISGGIQLGLGEYIDQRAVDGVCSKGVTVHILLEAFGNSPLNAKNSCLLAGNEVHSWKELY